MGYKVKLDVFEGPLDLLLYLIKKDELNIYDIPITRITGQYLEYLEFMESLDLDIAGDFILMTATLMQIKSKTLLPPDPEAPPEEQDPRAELVKRLLEYKAFKEAAEKLQGMEAERGNLFARWPMDTRALLDDEMFLEVSTQDLVSAFLKIVKNLPRTQFHEVTDDEYTVADKIHEITHHLVREVRIYFSVLFKNARSKNEVIACFLAILELVRLKEVVVRQKATFEEIEIQRNEKHIARLIG